MIQQHLIGSAEAEALRDLLFTPVPWRKADEVQSRLRRHGIRSTLHLDPARREARLEVWPGQDAALVQAVLEALQRPRRA
jgi:hypothetical protein